MHLSPVKFIPDPAFLVLKDKLEILEGNGYASELCGIRIEKLPGKDLHGFLPGITIQPGKFEEVLFHGDGDHQFPVTLEVHSFDEGKQACYLLVFREFEQKFRDLMESEVDGIIVLDRKLKVLEVNPAFCSIAELEPEDFVGSNGFSLVRKFIPKQYRKVVLSNLQKMASGKSVASFEIEYKEKTLSISTKIRKGSESYIVIFRDISKETEAQNAFLDSEEKFRFFAESTFEGVVIHNRGIVQDANDAFLRMTGYSRDDFGKNLLDFIPKTSDRARVVSNMLKRQPKPYHVTARKKDGSDFTIEIQSKDVRYKGKKVRISTIKDVTKQMVLQEKLMESEQRYRTIFEKTATANIIVEKDKTISLANSKFTDLVGYPLEEIVNKIKWDKFVFADDLERMNQWHDQRRNNPWEIPQEYEFRLIDRQNNIRNIHLFVDIIPGTDQSIVSLIDITGRKKAEIRSLENERQLKKAQSIAMMGSWSIDLSTKQVSASEETRRIYGLTQESISIEDIQDIPLPEYRELLDKAFSELISGESIYDVEFRIRNHNSGEIIDVHSMAEFNPGDKTITGVIQDISKMKQTELLIHQREKYLQSIFRATPVGIGVVVNRHFTGMNEKLCEITGYSEKELLNQSSRLLYLSDKDYEEVGTRKYDEISKHGTGAIETQWKCKDGTIKDILLSSTPMDADDLQKGVTFSAMNITVRKQAERDLLKKNKELSLARDRAEESDRLKTAFLANMSHEIRTPMNGILGFASLLEKPSLSSETTKSYIDIIKKSGDRLMATVNDLIDISRLETGQVNIVVADTDIHELLDVLFRFFERESQAKGLQLSCNKAFQGQDVILRSDEQKLNSVLTNLIKNAIKYTHQGSIEFGYTLVEKEAGTMLEFYIKDTGIGIVEDRQHAVFNRFEQADIEDRNVYEGSGLGLTIAKSLVEMLGGKIWLESVVGEGSTFFFTIPYITSEGKEPLSNKSKVINEYKDVPGNLKILIAEDDFSSFYHLSILTAKKTRKLLHVTTGSAAVKACIDNPDIDLVMMDIKMPDMNGLEATRRIREFNPAVPIIAQTAYAMPGDREKALESGCNDYISKPIHLEELMGKLAQHLK